MNLSQAIDEYIQRKRSYGIRFDSGTPVLRAFSGRFHDIALDRVTAQRVLEYLDASSSTSGAWRVKYGLLSRFFEYWSLRKEIPVLLLPPPRPAEPKTFVPYIYTRSQLRSLFNASKICQKRRDCKVEASTYRIFLLTLYATGAIFNEVRNLKLEDIDLKKSRITFHGKNARSIPIASDLRDELRLFLKARPRNTPKTAPVFVNKFGQPIRHHNLIMRFRRLRRIAGITRNVAASYQPRMHDLRATFAVHRITTWIKSGLDLNRMLPALAAYIGNVGLQSTDQYLALTPERFRKELQKLSPQRGRKRWRDDPALMKFLSSL